MPSDAPFAGPGFDEGVRCSRNDDGRALSQRLFSARARLKGLRTGAGPGGRQHCGLRPAGCGIKRGRRGDFTHRHDARHKHLRAPTAAVDAPGSTPGIAATDTDLPVTENPYD
jgi:hypothetical protein